MSAIHNAASLIADLSMDEVNDDADKVFDRIVFNLGEVAQILAVEFLGDDDGLELIAKVAEEMVPVPDA